MTASALLHHAREVDDIRFRAPDTLNAIIRSLSNRFGAIVVETEERLKRESPGGITGASLFEDHLHPNHRGYALMADEFFHAVRRVDGLSGSSLAGWDERREMLDPVDGARATLLISRLKGGYPFQKDTDLEQELAEYQSTLDTYLGNGNPFDSLAVRTLVGGLATARSTANGDPICPCFGRYAERHRTVEITLILATVQYGTHG